MNDEIGGVASTTLTCWRGGTGGTFGATEAHDGEQILIGTLTEHHPDHLIVSGVSIDVTERVSVEQFPIGTSLTVAYTLQGDKRIAASIRRSTG